MGERTDSGRRLTEHREALQLATKCIWLFLVCNLIVLVSVIAVTFIGEIPSTFMWVRAVILTAASPLLLWMTRRASESSTSMIARLRVMSTVLPIAVIVVDFIPGVAPMWYGVMQGIGALALIPVAVLTWRDRRLIGR